MRLYLAMLFLLALGYAQFRESGLPQLAAHLEIVTEDGAKVVPARVYLFKDGRPFRLSPVDALLPLRVDLFYRERLWKQKPRPQTLEVTCSEQSHFILLNGRGAFDLPGGKYRLEAYRGNFFKPAAEDFELRAGEKREVRLRLSALPRASEWLSGDDHIHLTRAPEDNDVFLGWLQAEDLSVANFLQLQRQMDAAAQYAFGPAGSASVGGYTIRPGQESRSAFYGHVNLLGPREILRPLSVGTVYANSPEAYPFPLVLFERGRKLGATVGYAHFDGSQQHSTLPMDLALGTIDFIEVFQFGVLKMEPWYQLLNAGFRITGIAGSDFPVPLNRSKAWPRAVPLLGPERTLVKARPGKPVYETWAEGVRSGQVVVTNGPLLELEVNATRAEGVATASFYRPIEKIEIVVNGQVAASRSGDGRSTELALPFRIPLTESSWLAARATSTHQPDEPELRAHTNPVYLLRDGKPVRVEADRRAIARRWEAEVEYYKSSALTFATEQQRRELIEKAESALQRIR